ncbi:hypothetical protein M885DRAFT_514546 [Pelagophyceae sp. CCMP2097]|nr:hypothetical protein M885DRAFT_514546 [Pelagophyceae sp. CCMP2097]
MASTPGVAFLREPQTSVSRFKHYVDFEDEKEAQSSSDEDGPKRATVRRRGALPEIPLLPAESSSDEYFSSSDDDDSSSDAFSDVEVASIELSQDSDDDPADDASVTTGKSALLQSYRFVSAISAQIEAAKARRRRERRHPTLVYFEKLHAYEQSEANRGTCKDDSQRLRCEAQEEARRDRIASAREFVAKVQSDDARRLRRTTRRRNRELGNTQQRMKLFEGWDVEARRAMDAFAKIETQRGVEAGALAVKARADGLVRARKDAVAAREADEEAMTQQTLVVMRRAGIIAGISAAAADEADAPRETDSHLTVRLRPGCDPALGFEAGDGACEKSEGDVSDVGAPSKRKPKKKKKKELPNVFTIDLKRFRNVDEMRGDSIGAVGAKQLARDLALGACPRLRALDLGWNRIQLRGLSHLSAALARKCSPELARLDLRANHLTASAVATLVNALGTGGVRLKELDLRQNLLGDAGACLVASAALRGALSSLEVLQLQSNDIRSQGLFALYQAFTAADAPRLIPNIRHVSLRYNKPHHSMLKNLQPCPAYFTY